MAKIDVYSGKSYFLMDDLGVFPCLPPIFGTMKYGHQQKIGAVRPWHRVKYKASEFRSCHIGSDLATTGMVIQPFCWESL